MSFSSRFSHRRETSRSSTRSTVAKPSAWFMARAEANAPASSRRPRRNAGPSCYNADIRHLARRAVPIAEHYQHTMDVAEAKGGDNGESHLIQAGPHSDHGPTRHTP